MTSEKSLEKLMKNVDESRRDFIRKAIWGTAFAVPVLASFSMEGGMIGTAEAYTCSNMTTYNGPDEFEAHLSGVNNYSGNWKGVLTTDGNTVAYKFKFPKKLEFKVAYLKLPSDNSSYITVAELDNAKGIIEAGDIKNAKEFCYLGDSRFPSDAGSNFIGLLQALSEGKGYLVATVSTGEENVDIEGSIVPEYS